MQPDQVELEAQGLGVAQVAHEDGELGVALVVAMALARAGSDGSTRVFTAGHLLDARGHAVELG